MTAKKDIIKDLRRQLADTQAQLASYRCGMATREKQFARIMQTNEREMIGIKACTDVIANKLQCNFVKEITWMELCNDSTSKFNVVKQVINSLELLAPRSGKKHE